MFCGYIRNISSILTYISFNKKTPALTHLQLFCNYMKITLHANCSDRCLIASLNRGGRIYPWVFSFILLDHLLPLLKTMKLWSSNNKFLFCWVFFSPTQTDVLLPPCLPLRVPQPCAARWGKPFYLWQHSHISKSSSRFVPKVSMVTTSAAFSANWAWGGTLPSPAHAAVLAAIVWAQLTLLRKPPTPTPATNELTPSTDKQITAFFFFWCYLSPLPWRLSLLSNHTMRERNGLVNLRGPGR